MADMHSFRGHLLLVLAGHRKLPTRLIHVLTATGMVSALLCALHVATTVPVFWLLVAIAAIFLHRAFQGAPQPLVLGLWTTAAVAVNTVVMLALLRVMTDDDISMGRCLLVFVAIGVPEHYSHRLFDDGDRNLITRGKTGPSKVWAIVWDVILPSPLFFWYLAWLDIRSCCGQPELAGMLREADAFVIPAAQATARAQESGPGSKGRVRVQ